MAGSGNDPRENLNRALAQMQRVMDAVEESHAGDPTPCEAWSVRDVVAHVVAVDLPNFEGSARGEPLSRRGTTDAPAPPWADAYRAGAERVTEAWAGADLATTVETPVGSMPLGARLTMMIAELVVHAWDLAKATGQEPDLDPELCTLALTWSQQNLRPEMRGEGKPFGAEVPVADSASIQDRTVAWFGRDPGWSAG